MVKTNWYNSFNWSFAFFVVFIADLLAVYLGEETFRQVTKPFLIPFLILYFIRETAAVQSALKKIILIALFFSWLGDVLLMYEMQNESFFIFGLLSFLVAHIFFILFFERIIVKEKLVKRYWIFLPVMIYYVLLISVLSPSLDELKWPVRIYGIVISYMLIKAFQVGWFKNRLVTVCIIPGAVLFVVSDSVLAINKFVRPNEDAGVIIMLTYGLAQFLIALGAIRYIKSYPAK